MWSARKSAADWRGTWSARIENGRNFTGTWEAAIGDFSGKTFAAMLKQATEKQIKWILAKRSCSRGLVASALSWLLLAIVVTADPVAVLRRGSDPVDVCDVDHHNVCPEPPELRLHK